MNATVCPINPPGHDWEAGLSCRWCDATRTPGEAVLSGLASVRGWSREAARAVRDAHRAQALNEAADLFERAGRIVLDGGIMTAAEFADKLRELAATGEKATAAAATATPDGFFVPGRTYAREHHASTIRFLVRYIDDSPEGIPYRVAFGWKTEDGDVCASPFDSDDMDGWVDVTGAGDGRG